MMDPPLSEPIEPRVPDPVAPTTDSELRAHVEKVLSAHYELDCEIGRGGMGIVYRARDRRLKRVVAIKVLPPELAFRSEIRSRFLREAETAAGLNHPNIVPIYSVDETEGLVFFVMAYVAGDNLAKRLHDHGVLGPDEVRRILREVGDALDFAHERGVVHRDIKPDNILLDADGERSMVTDFGIARAVTEGGDSRLTATGMAIGTPAYMSPEQAAGERTIDGRSDLYSLGVVAYQMLVGEPPFVASSTPAMLVKHISERPVPLEQRRSDLPTALSRAIMMCLEKDPANRFPSAGAFVEALTTGTMPQSSGARPAPESAARSSLAYPGIASPPVGGRGPSSISPLSGFDYDDLAPRYSTDSYGITSEEERRYNAPAVVEFRKKLAPYLFVNAVIVLASIFGSSDFFAITVLWSIFIAYRYARLWSDGYDWRDVFRQPRDKELIDVADEGIETMRSLLDRDKRQELREKRRELRASMSVRRSSGGLPRLTSPGMPSARYDAAEGQSSTRRPSLGAPSSASPAGAPYPSGGQAPPRPSPGGQSIAGPASPLDSSGRARVEQAKSDADQIIQNVRSLSPDRRQELPRDIEQSAIALAEKVRQLSIVLADIDRTADPGVRDAIEAEITRVEAEANPLDEARSEQRVRRLVLLKRERRAVADKATRRDEVAAKLETCITSLKNMRIELVRLRAGTHNTQNITGLVHSAQALADSVDGALVVEEELGRLARESRGSARPPAGR